jgi:hypothetical protein
MFTQYKMLRTICNVTAFGILGKLAHDINKKTNKPGIILGGGIKPIFFLKI